MHFKSEDFRTKAKKKETILIKQQGNEALRSTIVPKPKVQL